MFSGWFQAQENCSALFFFYFFFICCFLFVQQQLAGVSSKAMHGAPRCLWSAKAKHLGVSIFFWSLLFSPEYSVQPCLLMGLSCDSTTFLPTWHLMVCQFDYWREGCLGRENLLTWGWNPALMEPGDFCIWIQWDQDFQPCSLLGLGTKNGS